MLLPAAGTSATGGCRQSPDAGRFIAGCRSRLRLLAYGPKRFLALPLTRAGRGDVAARGSMYFQFANVLVFFAPALVLCGLIPALGILPRPAHPHRSKPH